VAITTLEFGYIRDLVRERAAIVLDDNKTYLVETRLAALARQENAASVAELVGRLRGKPYTPLHAQVVDALTTNETSWFRDVGPFEALRQQILPELFRRRAAERSVVIWSAACSSGQEPYTVAMILREHFPQLANWRVRIIATDLSEEMLARARDGRYGQLEVNRGLPAPLLVKYFRREGAWWRVNEDIRQMVEFRSMNLAAPWPVMPRVDICLLRNVLIYFDQETKRSVLGKARRVLRDDGWLFLGGAETTLNVDDSHERVQIGRATAYRLR
jgi:chemotaxis protein methyltransferase CheR